MLVLVMYFMNRMKVEYSARTHATSPLLVMNGALPVPPPAPNIA